MYNFDYEKLCVDVYSLVNGFQKSYFIKNATCNYARGVLNVCVYFIMWTVIGSIGQPLFLTTALSHQRHHKPLVATPKLNNWESKSYFIALRNLITYLYLSLEVGVNFMNSKMEL